MGSRNAYVGTETAGDVLTAANFDKLPGGLIGYSSYASNGTIAGTGTYHDTPGDGPGGVLAHTTGDCTGRLLVIMWSATIATPTTGTLKLIDFRLVDGTGELGIASWFPGSNLVPQTLSNFTLVPGGNGVTYKTQARVDSGGVDVSYYQTPTNRARLLVWDVGPSF